MVSALDAWATHHWGYRNYHTDDQSRNLWWLALLFWGEGWHNNHHAKPNRYSFRQKWWEIDVGAGVVLIINLIWRSNGIKNIALKMGTVVIMLCGMSFLALSATADEDDVTLRQGVEKYFSGEDAEAAKILRSIADNGDPIAQFYLGLVYDYREENGISYLEKSAEQCNINAIHMLLYYYGDEKRNPELFTRMMTQSDKYHNCLSKNIQQHPDARYLSVVLELLDRQKNLDEMPSFLTLLKTSTKQLNHREAIMLALLFSVVDLQLARSYFRAAARAGDSQAVRWLSYFGETSYEKEVWRHIDVWFQNGGKNDLMNEDGSSRDAKKFIASHYLANDSELQSAAKWCRSNSEIQKRNPVRFEKCFREAYNSEKHSQLFAMHRDLSDYRQSKLYDDLRTLDLYASRWTDIDFSLHTINRLAGDLRAFIAEKDRR